MRRSKANWKRHRWADAHGDEGSYCIRCGLHKTVVVHDDDINAEGIWTLPNGKVTIGNTPKGCVGTKYGFLGLRSVESAQPARPGWLIKRRRDRARKQIISAWARELAEEYENNDEEE